MNKILKKITAVFTSAVLLTSAIGMSTTAAFAADDEPVADQYIVAGDPDFIGGWDGTNVANLMTANEDGTYSKEYTVDHAYTNASLKVVKNAADWIGDQTGNNVVFDLTEAGTFTVVYHPDAEINDGLGYVTVEGDIVHIEVGMTVNSVYAAGNGEGAWLNGQNWAENAPGNIMTEISDDVWQISFDMVPDGFDRQIKFAINGAWTHNFGFNDLIEDGDLVIGEWMPAKYNGENITFDTDDICTVTATLDLSNFDFETKEGARYKIDVDYPQYIVAGDPDFIGGWDGANENNLMEYDADTNTWFIEYTVDHAYSNASLKVVKNATDWIGNQTGNNVVFNLTGEGTFKVVYYPDENYNDGNGYATVEGDIVFIETGMTVNSMYAAGNGEGAWLNGQNWVENAPGNVMTEIEADVWQITFTDVPDGFDRQIKFAVNGAWTHNFGFNDLIDQDFEPGVWMPAKYNGENITFDTDDICTITATLDLSNFDFETKQGAVYKIDIVYDTVIGDVDGDGEVTINDATDLQRYLSEFIDETDLDLTVADVNGDGKVNIKDVTEIQRMVAGLI